MFISEIVFISIFSFLVGCSCAGIFAIFRMKKSSQNVTQQLKDKLKSIQSDKFKAMAEMSSGVAHEINNPLAIILGRAQTMRMKAKQSKLNPEQLEEGLLKIEEVTQRIAKIVAGLRHVAQEGEKAAPENTSVHKILEDALTLWHQRMKNHEVELKLPTDLGEHWVYCKHILVVQSLMNLISNAYLAVKDRSEKWIEIQVHKNCEHLEIWVVDSGPGIPQENQSKIFEPFFTTREVGQGSGLGLSISAGIIQEQNGYLKLNPHSQTTCFIVGVPASKDQPKALAS